jgi:FMN-dependent NADH-azoreductase
MNILFIQASPRGARSVSSKYANEAIFKLKEKHPEATITSVDLNHQNPGFINQNWFD